MLEPKEKDLVQKPIEAVRHAAAILWKIKPEEIQAMEITPNSGMYILATENMMYSVCQEKDGRIEIGTLVKAQPMDPMEMRL